MALTGPYRAAAGAAACASSCRKARTAGMPCCTSSASPALSRAAASAHCSGWRLANACRRAGRRGEVGRLCEWFTRVQWAKTESAATAAGKHPAGARGPTHHADMAGHAAGRPHDDAHFVLLHQPGHHRLIVLAPCAAGAAAMVVWGKAFAGAVTAVAMGGWEVFEDKAALVHSATAAADAETYPTYSTLGGAAQHGIQCSTGWRPVQPREAQECEQHRNVSSTLTWWELGPEVDGALAAPHTMAQRAQRRQRIDDRRPACGHCGRACPSHRPLRRESSRATSSSVRCGERRGRAASKAAPTC